MNKLLQNNELIMKKLFFDSNFEVTEKFLLFYLTVKKRKFNLHFPKKPEPDM